MAVSPSSGASGSSGGIDGAIASFKAAQDEATAKSLKVATDITKINGEANAIKKISPG